MKNLLAVVVGWLVGGAVNMAIVILGPMLIPLPEGVDMSDMDRFAENLQLLKPANFIAPFLAHALGTLVGAFLAAKLAASHGMRLALGVASVFLLGGITVVVTYGGPVWFCVLDLVGAYLPMGYLGGVLARKRGIGTAT